MRALVTGGAAGLGAALAAGFVARGDDVLVADVVSTVPEEGAQRPSRRASSTDVAFIKLDVRSDDDWAAARDWVERALGRPRRPREQRRCRGRWSDRRAEHGRVAVDHRDQPVRRGARDAHVRADVQAAALRPHRQHRLARRAGAPGRDGLLQRGQGRGGGVQRDHLPRARGVRRALLGGVPFVLPDQADREHAACNPGPTPPSAR